MNDTVTDAPLPSADQQLLITAYAAFNAHDVEAVLRAMQPDVAWPNGWEGGYVRGHDEVRAYWTRQWAQVQPSVEPLGFTRLTDGRIKVVVQQTVRDLTGRLLVAGLVDHIYQLRDGLISRMEIHQPLAHI